MPEADATDVTDDTVGPPEPPVAHRSVSQVKQYQRCPKQYELTRISKVWARPAAWTAQGVAVHSAIEVWEKALRPDDTSEVFTTYTRTYDQVLTRELAATPTFSHWFYSGPYHPWDDIERRYDLGMEQLERYINYYWNNPLESSMVIGDTVLAEVEFDIKFGDVPVRGSIDNVITTNTHHIIRDTKTGVTPGDAFQLETYYLALKILYGIQASYGQFVMLKNKRQLLTKPIKLGIVDVVETYEEVDLQIRAGNFPAKPNPNICRRCPVFEECGEGVLN